MRELWEEMSMHAFKMPDGTLMLEAEDGDTSELDQIEQMMVKNDCLHRRDGNMLHVVSREISKYLVDTVEWEFKEWQQMPIA